jgi:hypothetical protein
MMRLFRAIGHHLTEVADAFTLEDRMLLMLAETRAANDEMRRMLGHTAATDPRTERAVRGRTR